MNERDEDGPQTDEAEDSGNEPASPIAPLLPRHIHRGWWFVLAGAGILALAGYANDNLHSLLFGLPDAGVSTTVPLVVGSAVAFVLLFPFRPYLGHVVDRRGPLIPVAVALLSGGFSYIVLASVGPGWLSYNLASFVGYVMAVSARIAILTMVANLFSRHVGKAFAVVLIGLAGAVFLPDLFTGAVFGVVGDTTVNRYGLMQMGIVLFIGGALCAVGLGFTYALRRWPLRGEHGWRIGTMILDAGDSGLSRDESQNEDVESQPRLRTILLRKHYLQFVAAISLAQLAQWPVFATRTDTSMIVAVTITVAVFVVPALLVSGTLADLFDKKIVVAVIFALQFVIALPLLAGSGWYTVVVLITLGSVTSGLAGPAVLALQRDYFGRQHFGLLLGIHVSVASLGSIVWPTINVIVQVDNHESPLFVLLSVMIPLAIALLLILLMKRPQDQNTPAESGTQVAV